MKLTKNCMYPWTFMQIHAGGMMQPCCVCQDMDMGDFIIDYIDNKKNGIDYDIFNNQGLQELRKGILTGSLRKMCRECFFVPNNIITIEQFEQKLKEYLKSKLPEGTDMDSLDLTKTYAYDWISLSLSNKCNLSCIYCVQSTQKDTNPYFKMDFPEEAIEETLDLIAAQNPSKVSTGVEGESTIYKNWRKVWTSFHSKYPNIKLQMTTNLSRNYTEDDLQLLINYSSIDVSCDSINPLIYSSLRRNGNLETVLKNLKMIDKKASEMGVNRPDISIHAVVSSINYKYLEELADFAFENNYLLVLGNYEERASSVGYQKNLLKPLSKLGEAEQKEAWEIIKNIKQKATNNGYRAGVQGDLFEKINNEMHHNYNLFSPFDENPIYKAFYYKYPNGTAQIHFSIVYDYDNNSYEGILCNKNSNIEMDNIVEANVFIIREVAIYKEGTYSSKYQQNILPRYRKKLIIENKIFSYKPDFNDVNVEKVLVQIVDFWKA